LARGGRYLWIGGSVPTLLQVVTIGAIVGRLTGRRLGLLAVRQGPDHFGRLGDLCARGEVETKIDRVSGLDEVAEAIRDVGEGRVLGKVVVEPDRHGQ
jgi:NADPH:quinone reductase-like Zn-dependent oxidoreductase